MIVDCVKKLSKTHGYRISSDYWGRMGVMHKRYGEDVLLEAIEKTPPQELSLDNALCLIERKCQYILENGELDELANDLLS